MRFILIAVACLATSLCTTMSAVRAEEPAPDGDKILALLGADVPAVFATLGGPTSAFVFGRDDKPEAEDMIYLDYRTFYLELAYDRKSVALIKFAPVASDVKGNEWTGSIRGFKYGDGREKVQAALGQPYGSSGFGKTKDGKDIMSGIDYFKVNDKNGRLEVHYNNYGNAFLAQAIGTF